MMDEDSRMEGNGGSGLTETKTKGTGRKGCNKAKLAHLHGTIREHTNCRLGKTEDNELTEQQRD